MTRTSPGSLAPGQASTCIVLCARVGIGKGVVGVVLKSLLLEVDVCSLLNFLLLLLKVGVELNSLLHKVFVELKLLLLKVDVELNSLLLKVGLELNSLLLKSCVEINSLLLKVGVDINALLLKVGVELNSLIFEVSVGVVLNSLLFEVDDAGVLLNSLLYEVDCSVLFCFPLSSVLAVPVSASCFVFTCVASLSFLNVWKVHPCAMWKGQVRVGRDGLCFAR